VPDIKRCPNCEQNKPRAEFYGQSWCRPCKYEQSRQWRLRNPGYKAQWRRDNPDKNRAYARKKQLKSEYGITPEDYDDLFIEQDGRCAICFNTSPYTLHVDHNHDTNEIRGLLCKACNRGLGMFRDNVTLVESALSYLRRFECS